MTLEEFRIYHSQIIEQFQFMEYNLKRIISKKSGVQFLEALDALEKDNLGHLIRYLHSLEKDKHMILLLDEDYAMLERLRERRNYWCHQCYLDLIIKKDEKRQLILKSDGGFIGIKSDLRDIENLGVKIQELYYSI